MRRLLFCLSLLQAPAAFASHEDLGLGARAAGMGEAFTAVGDDVSAVAFNPAGLGAINNTQFLLGYRRAFQTPAGALDFHQLEWAAAAPVDAHPLRGAVAAHGLYTPILDLSLDRTLGLTYGTRGWRELSFGVLDIGASLKALSRSGRTLAGGVTKAGVDIGALLRVGDDWSFGAAVQNLNGPRTSIGGVEDRAPVIARAGFAQALRGFTLAADAVVREPSGGRRATRSVNAGLERWLQTARFGGFAPRMGLSLGDQSKSWRLGLGWRALGGQVDYAVLVPLASGSRWGSAVSLLFRFGAWNPDKEYERVLGTEIRYRLELSRALEAAEVKQWRLADDLRRLRTELQALKAELEAKAADEEAAQARAKAAQDKIRQFEEREREAQRRLEQIERDKQALRAKTKETLFREDWLAFQKLKLQGAPDAVLLEQVKRLLREYKETGVDLSEANQELLRLLRSRPTE